MMNIIGHILLGGLATLLAAMILWNLSMFSQLAIGIVLVSPLLYFIGRAVAWALDRMHE